MKINIINSNFVIIVGSLILLILFFGPSLIEILNVYVYAYNSTYDPNTDLVIKEGLEQCFNLQNNQCLEVMETIDKKCQVEYFPSCFGPQWNPYMDHLEQLIEKGIYPDEKYKEDPFLTLNNHHYGNSDIK